MNPWSDIRGSLEPIGWIFKGTHAIRNYAIGVVLGFIPLLQWMSVGYCLLVMEDTLNGRAPRMRDWKDVWARCFALGLKTFGLLILYWLPSAIFTLLMWRDHVSDRTIVACYFSYGAVVYFLFPLIAGRMLIRGRFSAGLALVPIFRDLWRTGTSYVIAWLGIAAVGTGFYFTLPIIPIRYGYLIPLILFGFAILLWASALWGRVLAPVLRPNGVPETPAPAHGV